MLDWREVTFPFRRGTKKGISRVVFAPRCHRDAHAVRASGVLRTPPSAASRENGDRREDEEAGDRGREEGRSPHEYLCLLVAGEQARRSDGEPSQDAQEKGEDAELADTRNRREKSGEESPAVELFDIKHGVTLKWRVTAPVLPSGPSCAAFSPDASLLAVGCLCGSLLLFLSSSGECCFSRRLSPPACSRAAPPVSLGVGVAAETVACRALPEAETSRRGRNADAQRSRRHLVRQATTQGDSSSVDARRRGGKEEPGGEEEPRENSFGNSRVGRALHTAPLVSLHWVDTSSWTRGEGSEELRETLETAVTCHTPEPLAFLDFTSTSASPSSSSPFNSSCSASAPGPSFVKTVLKPPTLRFPGELLSLFSLDAAGVGYLCLEGRVPLFRVSFLSAFHRLAEASPSLSAALASPSLRTARPSLVTAVRAAETAAETAAEGLSPDHRQEVPLHAASVSSSLAAPQASSDSQASSLKPASSSPLPQQPTSERAALSSPACAERREESLSSASLFVAHSPSVLSLEAGTGPHPRARRASPRLRQTRKTPNEGEREAGTDAGRDAGRAIATREERGEGDWSGEVRSCEVKMETSAVSQRSETKSRLGVKRQFQALSRNGRTRDRSGRLRPQSNGGEVGAFPGDENLLPGECEGGGWDPTAESDTDGCYTAKEGSAALWQSRQRETEGKTEARGSATEERMQEEQIHCVLVENGEQENCMRGLSRLPLNEKTVKNEKAAEEKIAERGWRRQSSSEDETKSELETPRRWRGSEEEMDWEAGAAETSESAREKPAATKTTFSREPNGLAQEVGRLWGVHTAAVSPNLSSLALVLWTTPLFSAIVSPVCEAQPSVEVCRSSTASPSSSQTPGVSVASRSVALSSDEAPTTGQAPSAPLRLKRPASAPGCLSQVSPRPPFTPFVPSSSSSYWLSSSPLSSVAAASPGLLSLAQADLAHSVSLLGSADAQEKTGRRRPASRPEPLQDPPGREEGRISSKGSRQKRLSGMSSAASPSRAVPRRFPAPVGSPAPTSHSPQGLRDRTRCMDSEATCEVDPGERDDCSRDSAERPRSPPEEKTEEERGPSENSYADSNLAVGVAIGRSETISGAPWRFRDREPSNRRSSQNSLFASSSSSGTLSPSFSSTFSSSSSSSLPYSSFSFSPCFSSFSSSSSSSATSATVQVSPSSKRPVSEAFAEEAAVEAQMDARCLSRSPRQRRLKKLRRLDNSPSASPASSLDSPASCLNSASLNSPSSSVALSAFSSLCASEVCGFGGVRGGARRETETHEQRPPERQGDNCVLRERDGAANRQRAEGSEEEGRDGEAGREEGERRVCRGYFVSLQALRGLASAQRDAGNSREDEREGEKAGTEDGGEVDQGGGVYRHPRGSARSCRIGDKANDRGIAAFFDLTQLSVQGRLATQSLHLLAAAQGDLLFAVDVLERLASLWVYFSTPFTLLLRCMHTGTRAGSVAQAGEALSGETSWRQRKSRFSGQKEGQSRREQKATVEDSETRTEKDRMGETKAEEKTSRVWNVVDGDEEGAAASDAEGVEGSRRGEETTGESGEAAERNLNSAASPEGSLDEQDRVLRRHIAFSIALGCPTASVVNALVRLCAEVERDVRVERQANRNERTQDLTARQTRTAGEQLSEVVTLLLPAVETTLLPAVRRALHLTRGALLYVSRSQFFEAPSSSSPSVSSAASYPYSSFSPSSPLASSPCDGDKTSAGLYSTKSSGAARRRSRRERPPAFSLFLSKAVARLEALEKMTCSLRACLLEGVTRQVALTRWIAALLPRLILPNSSSSSSVSFSPSSSSSSSSPPLASSSPFSSSSSCLLDLRMFSNGDKRQGDVADAQDTTSERSCGDRQVEDFSSCSASLRRPPGVESFSASQAFLEGGESVSEEENANDDEETEEEEEEDHLQLPRWDVCALAGDRRRGRVAAEKAGVAFEGNRFPREEGEQTRRKASTKENTGAFDLNRHLTKNEKEEMKHAAECLQSLEGPSAALHLDKIHRLLGCIHNVSSPECALLSVACAALGDMAAAW
uniref:Uncharacterized protein n=1 Tax=Toxoplasma gondii COUG TaxID=1074873 RepID=A0A2G8YAA7_TOXGO|nr:hypothetical protein TGCOUG_233735A [Toxoplasma gondii COUG]